MFPELVLAERKSAFLHVVPLRAWDCWRMVLPVKTKVKKALS